MDYHLTLAFTTAPHSPTPLCLTLSHQDCFWLSFWTSFFFGRVGGGGGRNLPAHGKNVSAHRHNPCRTRTQHLLLN